MESTTTATEPRKWPRRLLIAIIILLVVVVLGISAFLIYASDYYRTVDSSPQIQSTTEQAQFTQGDNYLAFGDPTAEQGLIFYPGAKVEYSAYSPIMKELAEQGYFCIIVEMPLNFAFFDINAATPLIEQYSEVDSWWIGGHSLGGSMAASYAANNSSELEGLLLLGSYSASDLSDTNLYVCSIYGSDDDVLNRDQLASSRSKMPPHYSEHVIEGGNHAQFGNYGEQAGDGQATISPEDQWQQTTAITTQEFTSAKGS